MSLQTTPLISVVVPVFNTENELRRCLDSIRAQSHRHLQVLIINDGSTDASPEIAREFCAQDPRFTLHNKSNGGLSDARNFGLAKVAGEFCIFVDSDDVILPEFAAKLLRRSQELSTDVTICLVQVKDAVSGENKYQTRMFKPGLEQRAFDFKDVADVMFQGAVVAWNKMYRTDFLQKNKLSFLKGLHFEDLPFFAEVMVKARRVGFVNEVLHHYFLMRPGSLTEKKSEEYLDIPVTLRHAQNFLQKEGCYDLLKASFLDYKWERLLSAYVMIAAELKPQFLALMKKELTLDAEDMKRLGKQIKFG
jgi:glycosyltransferase involved in cell wall biosynthesis